MNPAGVPFELTVTARGGRLYWNEQLPGHVLVDRAAPLDAAKARASLPLDVEFD